LDAATTLFMIVDAQAPTQTILYTNRAHAAFHGYQSPQDLEGKSASVLIDTYSPEDKRELLEVAIREGRAVRLEVQADHRNGTRAWLGISSIPISTRDGEVTHFVTLGADITSRLEAERKKEDLQNQLVSEMRERERMAIELRLAQKLESVGRLAAGLAHEINTPTQYVSDSVYFLKTAFDDLNGLFNVYRSSLGELAADTNRPEVLDRLTELETSSDLAFLQQEVPRAFVRTTEGIERVAGIVRAMKEFAYPDVGEHSPADLNHALMTTLTVARSEYKYAATVTTHFGELPHVLCNISELNQVFLNLIVNAAHAIADSGKDFSRGHITIRTRTGDDDFVEIGISDNGCGINTDNLDRIFDPFFTTKEVGRGTGQGLAIAHSIVVDKHAGDIRVSSAVGEGTTFLVRLPVNNRRFEKAIS
jgi:PAS domain S-box-containing protein